MDAADILLEKFTLQGLKRNDEIYFKLSTAFEIISECKKNDISVVGIEGFLLDGNLLKPQLDMIADFSDENISDWKSYCQECNNSAEEFLNKISLKNKNLMINFVLRSK